MNKKISIIIPTYNHCEDLLKPCVESIIRYTDLLAGDIEVIIVANGCTDNTKQYLDELVKIYNPFKILWFDKPLGYTKATNEGIKAASGKFIILLNNDIVLLEQGQNTWLNRLIDPFKEDELLGITGTKGKICEYTGHWFLIFFCVAIRKNVIDKIGFLDEEFNPGFGEDTDFCIKTVNAGFKIKEICNYSDESHYISDYPIYHKAEGTMNDSINKEMFSNSVLKNIELLKQRYPKNNSSKIQIDPPNERELNSPKISIIIPTYNHCEDLLKPCIESIIRYTDLFNVEIIISANGCTDNTKEYINSLDPNIFKLIWSDEAIGFTKATNKGITQASGEYIILLNNDVELISQEKNDWINKLLQPFNSNEKIGITGPMKVHCQYANAELIIFFCVCIKHSTFDEIGLLDESFSPGYGEDTDFCVRCKQKGYKLVQVPEETQHYYDSNKMTGDFPIYHKGNETFKSVRDNEDILSKNRIILATKYNPSIKLNLGCGEVKINGFLNADKYRRDVDLILDATDLSSFYDDTVDEIIAINLVERINPYKVSDMFKEWFRVLKPNGKLTIEVPNMIELCKDFEQANIEKKYEYLNHIFGTYDMEHPPVFGWFEQTLTEHIKLVGFSNIQISTNNVSKKYNFRVQAEKILQPNYSSSDKKIQTIVKSNNIIQQEQIKIKETDIPKELPEGWFADHDIDTYRKLIEEIPENGIMLEIGHGKENQFVQLPI